jgi:hypothetical protein
MLLIINIYYITNYIENVYLVNKELYKLFSN